MKNISAVQETYIIKLLHLKTWGKYFEDSKMYQGKYMKALKDNRKKEKKNNIPRHLENVKKTEE